MDKNALTLLSGKILGTISQVDTARHQSFPAEALLPERCCPSGILKTKLATDKGPMAYVLNTRVWRENLAALLWSGELWRSAYLPLRCGPTNLGRWVYRRYKRKRTRSGACLEEQDTPETRQTHTETCVDGEWDPSDGRFSSTFMGERVRVMEHGAFETSTLSPLRSQAQAGRVAREVIRARNHARRG